MLGRGGVDGDGWGAIGWGGVVWDWAWCAGMKVGWGVGWGWVVWSDMGWGAARSYSAQWLLVGPMVAYVPQPSWRFKQ